MRAQIQTSSHTLSWPEAFSWGMMWRCPEAVEVLHTAGVETSLSVQSMICRELLWTPFFFLERLKGKENNRDLWPVTHCPCVLPWTGLGSQLRSHCCQKKVAVLHSTDWCMTLRECRRTKESQNATNDIFLQISKAEISRLPRCTAGPRKGREQEMPGKGQLLQKYMEKVAAEVETSVRRIHNQVQQFPKFNRR